MGREELKVYGLLLSGHFMYVAFKAIASLENTNDGIGSRKNIRFLFLILLFKSVEYDWW